MKKIKIAVIKNYLHSENFSAQYYGDENICITTFSNISELKDNTIAWIKNKEYLNENVLEALKQYHGIVIVCPWKTEEMKNCIVTDSPKEVFFSILNHFFTERKINGISEKAIVETKDIGNNVSIGPGCYICEDVEIADDVTLHANVVIDCPCKIGKGTEIFAGVVIGTDGFGYYHHNGIPERVPHFGGVVIGDNVDIGANTCIDRGCLGDTVIGNNVKIDNLCHIAHNVIINDNAFIIVGSVLLGSCILGKDSYIAPSSTILNQITINDKAYVGMGSVVLHNVKEGQKVFGNPARPVFNGKEFGN